MELWKVIFQFIHCSHQLTIFLEILHYGKVEWQNSHWVSVRIQSFSGPYFPYLSIFSPTVVKCGSGYWHFLRSEALYTRASFCNFIEEIFVLVLALHLYCGDKNQNTDFFQNTCFEERRSMTLEQTSKYRQTFRKEQCLPVATWIKKHISKQILTVTYTLEKTFFAVPTFEGLWVVSLQIE